MNDPRPGQFRLEWLAAHADDELTASQRQYVDGWLCTHPEARETLDVQESLSPANVDLWASVRPPMPSEADWQAVSRTVSQRLSPVRPARRWWYSAGLGLLATASLWFLATFPFPAKPLPPGEPSVESTVQAPADEEVFVMAGEEDLRIVSLPESAADLLLVGSHPLRDSILHFARGSELQFLGVGADLSGRFPELMTDTTEDVQPLLWAPREPRP